MNELEELVQKIYQFRDDRNWQQFHNLKDLALSLSLEASELLELFQWKTSEEAVEKNLDKMKDELADVLMYAIFFANEAGIDLTDAIKNKLELNNRKYPKEQFKNSSKKYNEIE